MKFKMVDCRHVKNRLLAITQQPIVRFQWNFAWGSRIASGCEYFGRSLYVSSTHSAKSSKQDSIATVVDGVIQLQMASYFYTLSPKNMPSCSFNKHGLILIILGKHHQHTVKNDMHIQLSLSFHFYFICF